MFTGIIEAVGKIAGISNSEGTRRIHVAAPGIAHQLQIGESVAVSGVCLTVVEHDELSFCADLAAETWARTSLSRLVSGSLVNLERALAANARLGGHMVQGHVDATATFVGSEDIPGAEDKWLHFQVPPELDPLLVYKGSVAIEGVSLTVARLDGNRLTIAVIPHTLEATNLSTLNPGDPVNLETDVLARYFAKWNEGKGSAAGSAAAAAAASPAGVPRYAIVVSRFNNLITSRLLSEARECLNERGVGDERIAVIHVPGAYEIPRTANKLAATGRYAAVLCLGCVIRGETLHFELIAGEVARGIGQSAMETGVPHAFGVIACDTQDQALARVGLKSGNMGREAAETALAMTQVDAEIAALP